MKACIAAVFVLLLLLGNAIIFLAIAYTHYPYGLPWAFWIESVLESVKRWMENARKPLANFRRGRRKQ